MLAEQVRSIIDVIPAAEFARPADLGRVVEEHAQAAGALTAQVFVVDYEQRHLRRLDQPGETIDIDGSLGGLAYRTTQRVDIDSHDGWLVWLPLVDGTARHGALRLEVPALDDDTTEWAEAFANVVTLLLLTRSPYSDALTQARRSKPLDLATELRYAMMPPSSFATTEVEVAGVLEPAYEVAGDGYDYALNGDVLSLAITDAVGHGLESSRIANLATAAFRHARRDSVSLADVYREADRAIAQTGGPEMFVTAQFAELDVTSGRLRLVNAGHPPPLLLRNQRHGVTVTCPPAPPLGIGDPDAEPDVHEVDLEPGDMLLFYTDGVVDARSPDGLQFGLERLEDFLVRATASDEPPAELLRRLVHQVLDHAASPLGDDACLLLVKWPGRG